MIPLLEWLEPSQYVILAVTISFISTWPFTLLYNRLHFVRRDTVEKPERVAGLIETVEKVAPAENFIKTFSGSNAFNIYLFRSTSTPKFVSIHRLQYAEKTYTTRIYRYHKKEGGFIHIAGTVLDSGDSLVSEGNTIEEVLAKQRRILPSALLSRSILRNETSEMMRSPFSGRDS